ncbi:unnamed protein product [Ectocarpus sp. CCAP 1310/34]|nr:unnamed protein product [Ectocarpus sp. CCAP 1310/34]
MAHRVQLALYDLSRGMAKAMSMAILGKQIDGIWHTGIIVYGKEYFFGGGLQSMPHEQFVQMHGGVGPTEYIELGYTDLTQELFEDFNREVQPRFTAQTYDLMKHNCNTYSNEASQFLLGKGIPEYIVNLPQEVLNSPMGGMLRPLVEQMTTQMNGADPYSALHHLQQQQQLAGAGSGAGAAASQPTQTPGAAAAAAAEQRAAAAGASAADPPQCKTDGFPILDKHTKPLVGSDTAKAAPGVVARVKALGATVKLLSEEEIAVLDALPPSMAATKTTPVAPGGFRLMQKILTKDSGWPEKATFLALVLMSLMVLHQAEGTEMEEAMMQVAKRVQTAGNVQEQLSAQALSMAMCSAANCFATAGGSEYMARADVMPGWLDSSLAGLQHERGEVRQMCSALLNNFSLVLSDAIASKTAAGGPAVEMSDETTQILFGALDGLQDETSQLVALRRVLSVGRLVRASGSEAASLINDVGLRDQVEGFLSKAKEGEAKNAAAELLRLLG